MGKDGKKECHKERRKVRSKHINKVPKCSVLSLLDFNITNFQSSQKDKTECRLLLAYKTKGFLLE